MEKEKLYKEFEESTLYKTMEMNKRIILWNIILTAVAVVLTIIILFAPIIKVSGEKFFTYNIRTVKSTTGNSSSSSNNDDDNARREVSDLIIYLLVDCPVDTYLKIKDSQIKAAVQQEENKNRDLTFSNSDTSENESLEDFLEIQRISESALKLTIDIAQMASELCIIESDAEFEESLKIAAKNFGKEYSAELNLIDYFKLAVGESFWGVALKGLKVGNVPFMFMSDPFISGYGVLMPVSICMCALFNVLFLIGSIIQFCVIKRLTFIKFANREKKTKQMRNKKIIYIGNLFTYLLHFIFVGLALIPVKLAGYWDVFLNTLSYTPAFIAFIIIEVVAYVVAIIANHI